jgi:hypothetical protein
MRKTCNDSRVTFQFQITCERGREQDLKLLVSQSIWDDEVALVGIRGRALDVRWTKMVVEVAAEQIMDDWIERFIRRVATEPGVVDIGMKFVGRAASQELATEAS